MWISVEGNIGCGKTTLLNNINYNHFKEPVGDWVDYLDEFYRCPNGDNAFYLQSKISCSFLDIEGYLGNGLCVTERSMYSCHNIFTKNHFPMFSVFQKDILNSMYSLSKRKPDYYIYLRCTVDVLVDRIHKRGEDIDRSYIEKINDLHELHFINKLQNVFIIDANNPIDIVCNDFVSVVNLISNI